MTQTNTLDQEIGPFYDTAAVAALLGGPDGHREQAAQGNKVPADALKLVHVALARGGVHRKVLCLSHAAAAAPCTGRIWYAVALCALQVECHVVPPTERWRQRILKAQRRQYR